MLSVSTHRQNLVHIHLFILKILSGSEILILFKGRNSVMNRRKWMLNNHKLDVVSINDYVNLGQNPFIRSQDIERGNETLISFKGRNSVTKGRKWTLNNLKLHVVNINASAKFVKIHLFILKILSGNKILTSLKGHNSVTNWRKWTLTLRKLLRVKSVISINLYYITVLWTNF